MDNDISENAKKVLRDNLSDVMEKGPRLSYNRGICVLAKNSEHNQILLGGLGGMGIGQMWVQDCEDVKRYAGYEDAPDKPRGSYFNDFTGRWVDSSEPW